MFFHGSNILLFDSKGLNNAQTKIPPIKIKIKIQTPNQKFKPESIRTRTTIN